MLLFKNSRNITFDCLSLCLFNAILLVTLYYMTFNFQTYTFLLLQDYTEMNFEAISAIPPGLKNF